MGQDPLVATPDSRGAIATVRITRPYGRLGNNVYQVLNAALVACSAGFSQLLVPPDMTGLDLAGPVRVEGLCASTARDEPTAGCLAGSFYVPFGCEEPALCWSVAQVERLTRGLCDVLFADPLAKVDGPERIAVAFRAGDVFVHGPRTPIAYTPPPAAYYLRAIDHACSAFPGAELDLVFEDRSNPSVAIVEEALDAAGIAFRSRAGSMMEDFARLLAARALVSCPSTFVEAAALVSRNLDALYSFRDHRSQPEFKPFMQWQLARVLGQRGVRAILVDDVSRTYTNKWQWTASPEQIEAIRSFSIENLRLYESL